MLTRLCPVPSGTTRDHVCSPSPTSLGAESRRPLIAEEKGHLGPLPPIGPLRAVNPFGPFQPASHTLNRQPYNTTNLLNNDGFGAETAHENAAWESTTLGRWGYGLRMNV